MDLMEKRRGKNDLCSGRGDIHSGIAKDSNLILSETKTLLKNSFSPG